jgi:hypothetical protein
MDVDTLTLTLAAAFVLGYLMNGIKNYWLMSLRMPKKQGKITNADLKVISKQLNSSTMTKSQKPTQTNSNTMPNSTKDLDVRSSQTKPMNKSSSGEHKGQRYKKSYQYSKAREPKYTEKPSASSSADMSTNGK